MTILLGDAATIALIAGAVVATLAVLPLLVCPRKVHMDRSILINGPIETIFQNVATTRHWLHWSPWFKRDPNIEVQFNDVPKGVGARYDWKGNRSVGEGSLEIVAEVPPHRVHFVLSFVGQGDAEADFQLQQEGDAVKATWGFDSDMGLNPIRRVFGLFMDRLLGPDYEEGLRGLKTISEQGIPSRNDSSDAPNAPAAEGI